MSGGLGAFGGAQPAGGMPSQGFGGIPQGQPQGFGGLPPMGGGLPPQGFGGFAQPPVAPAGGGGFGMPPPSMGGQQMGMQQQQQQQEATVEAPEDMGCQAGPHAAAWDAAKQRFRAVSAAPLGMAPREVLVQTLEAVMQDLTASKALSPEFGDECGLGKLCLQLLSMLTMEDPTPLAQLFSSVEPIASPVLTLLLDVPWAFLAQSGWPLFGLLAQLNLRKGQAPGAINTAEIDGLNDPVTQAFGAQLQAALAQDGAALEVAAQTFLQQATGAGSALAPLTAMAAQAAGTPQLPMRAQMLGAMQSGLKQVIGNAPELDIALSTQWPLWGLLHIAVDSLAGA